MIAILRQFALVLWAIISRPWALLMLGFGLLCLGPVIFPNTSNGRGVSDRAMTAVPVVAQPSGFGSEKLRKIALQGRLGSVTEFRTWPEHVEDQILVLPDGKIGVLGNGGRVGGWHNLDQLPALEKLWMSPPDMLSEEGWRRIGEHTALEVLSLPNVSSPDPETLRRFPDIARAALERLPRLRELDLRGTGGSFELLLPPLPGIEILAIGWGRLEENLRTIADGSPRLGSLAIETYRDFEFTPAMIESLRRMPRLRQVFVAAAFSADDEPAMRRQVAELRRSLPGVAIHPGTYRSSRVWTAVLMMFFGAYLPFLFWFQSSLLLSTSLAWMLPRRLAPHLFWPMAVAAGWGGAIVAMLTGWDVTLVPSLSIALFATMLAAGGQIGDVGGLAGRISAMVHRAELFAMLAAGATALLAPWVIDRWLSGTTPVIGAVLLAGVVAAAGWKLVRHTRLPRILTGLQLATPPGIVIDGTQGSPSVQRVGGFAGWQLSLAERGADRQIGRPVPAPFADMLRRPQPRSQVAIAVGIMFIVMGALMAALSVMFARNFQNSPPFSQLFQVMLTVFAWQACLIALAQTAVTWAQRRGSLVIDFLRPVSRTGYWRGLREAIARDLAFPAVLGVICAGSPLFLSGRTGAWAWGVAAACLIGIVALTYGLILLLAVTRWPLVVGTLLVLLLVAAMIGAGVAMGNVLSTPADLLTALLAAGAVLAVGLGISAGVLWRIEEREIG